ncbi:sensor histidine kinase [Bacillus suaedaesalsae]|uniref:histidine kinase n=1 Tax=Bacillus suaedaesalsae TaxID=2810349 RepID=A0ABS2DKW7_9BACI|nr:ATP-binding protein [Bacillus suaedaesalsae]MBM6619142.1 hypothetical protein [Bacillus suaedaesalsae]
MYQILKELTIYLFVFRWMLLIVGFLTFVNSSHENYYIIIYLLASNLISLITLFRRNKTNFLFFFISFDIITNLFILNATGGIESPFYLYSITSLLWLLKTGDERLFTPVIASFFIVLFIVSIDQLDDRNGLLFIFGVLFVCSMYVVLKYFFTSIKGNMRKGYAIYQTIKKSPDNPVDFTHYYEEMLKKLLNHKEAYLLLFETKEIHNNWKNQYLLRRVKESSIKNKHKTQLIKLPNYQKGLENYHYVPIHDDKNLIGMYLIKSTNGFRLKRTDNIYLYLLTATLNQVRQHFKLKEEMAKSLKEDVRKKMAQDMHDGLAQQLFFLSAQMYQFKNSLALEDVKTLQSLVPKMEEQIKQCHLEVRTFIKELRDEQIHKSNLFEALETLIHRITDGTNINVEYTTIGNIQQERVEVEQMVYRIVEESVNNVVKHSKASFVQVAIEASPLQLSITIKDNGVGFVVGKKQTDRYGLVGMRERVGQLGGHLDILSNVNNGTEVIALLPRERSIDYV